MTTLISPQLQAFKAIADYQSVHAASRALYITQTAVTQRLKNLETHLGVTLFLRKKNGMILTQEGQTLLHHCHITRDSERHTLQRITGKGYLTPARMTISSPSSLMNSRIIPACASVLKNFPKLMISFVVNDSEQRHQLLKTGECDLAIIQQHNHQSEFHCKELAYEQYVLLSSPEWRSSDLITILSNQYIIDYEPADEMTFNYLKKFNLHPYANFERYFANQTQSLLNLILAGVGYGVLTWEFCQSYLENNQLMLLNQGKIYYHRYLLAWHPRPEMPQYFQKMIDAIN
jgi:DNA-binding transcriptional LysR family regulator